MTTHRIQAIRLGYDASGSTVSAGSGYIDIVVGTGQTGFTYSVYDTRNGVADIVIAPDSIAGISYSSGAQPPRFETYAVTSEIEWSGGTTTIVSLYFETGSGAEEYIFVVDGPDFPVPTSVAEWSGVSAQISNLSVPSGPFGPGANIPFTALDITSTTESDNYVGTSDDDAFAAGTGKDLLSGLEGDDTLEGGRGADELNGGSGADDLFGGRGADELNGGSGADDLFGGRGADELNGGSGRDRLSGDRGDDTLNGGSGRDELNGGVGDDFLVGERGLDTFVFSENFGSDTVSDFDANSNREVIDLSDVASIRNFGDLSRNHMEQVGDDVIVDAGGGNTITLLDVDINDLGRGDFIF